MDSEFFAANLFKRSFRILKQCFSVRRQYCCKISWDCLRTIQRKSQFEYRRHDLLDFLPEGWVNILSTSLEACNFLMDIDFQVCLGVLNGLMNLSRISEVRGIVLDTKADEGLLVSHPQKFQ
jgi:hypothetical protein